MISGLVFLGGVPFLYAACAHNVPEKAPQAQKHIVSVAEEHPEKSQPTCSYRNPNCHHH